MRAIKRRLRDIEGFAPPDLWSDITRHEPRPLPSVTPPGRRLAVALLALAVSAAGFVLVSRAFRSPDDPAPAGPIRHLSDGPIWARGGGGEAGGLIFAVDPATGTKSPLWSDGRAPGVPGFEVAPQLIAEDYAFSPDGSRVAFSAYAGEDAATTEIFAMSVDGTELTQMTHDGAYAGFPSWSPDGTQIVYSSYRGDDYVPGCLGSTLCPGDLYVVGVDGGRTRRLTDGSGDESMPTWSADGRSIAFRRASGDSPDAVSVIDTEAGRLRTITTGPGGTVLYPQWSPDASRILFLGAGPRDPFGVWIVRGDGSGLRRLAQTNADTPLGPPVWSPTGTEIAFGDVAHGEPQLWVMNADGAERRLLAELPTYGLSPLAWQRVWRASESFHGLVIHIEPPVTRDGKELAPRFHASYRGMTVPLDPIETPGSELEYPRAVAPVSLAAGAPIEIHAEGARTAAVFELRSAEGEYVEHGSCIVPGAITSFPRRTGPSAFFIYVEWGDGAGGMGFAATLDDEGTSPGGAATQTAQVDARLLGLAVCKD